MRKLRCSVYTRFSFDMRAGISLKLGCGRTPLHHGSFALYKIASSFCMRSLARYCMTIHSNWFFNRGVQIRIGTDLIWSDYNFRISDWIGLDRIQIKSLGKPSNYRRIIDERLLPQFRFGRTSILVSTLESDQSDVPLSAKDSWCASQAFTRDNLLVILLGKRGCFL